MLCSRSEDPHRAIDVAIVAGTIQLSKHGKVIRVH
jgi:hypothetical protein